MTARIGTENLLVNSQSFFEQLDGLFVSVILTVCYTLTCFRARYISVYVNKMQNKNAESTLVKCDGTFKVTAKYALVSNESTYTSDTATHCGAG